MKKIVKIILGISLFACNFSAKTPELALEEMMEDVISELVEDEPEYDSALVTDFYEAVFSKNTYKILSVKKENDHAILKVEFQSLNKEEFKEKIQDQMYFFLGEAIKEREFRDLFYDADTLDTEKYEEIKKRYIRRFFYHLVNYISREKFGKEKTVLEILVIKEEDDWYTVFPKEENRYNKKLERYLKNNVKMLNIMTGYTVLEDIF